jgi:enoyl-CoA hydratase/carnithine racemase
MQAQPSTTITVPKSWTTSPDDPIRITNYPESSKTVTPILVVALNRPDKLNSFTGEMFHKLEQFFTVVSHDRRVKVVVLTGAGTTFSAGIDLNMDARVPKNVPLTDIRDIGGRVSLAMFNCSKTIIVAYNGLAVGVALTATLAAAIRQGNIAGHPASKTMLMIYQRIASSKSKFGFPFARIGLNMESASGFFLPRMVGYGRATYLTTTGLTYPAESKALDGLFSELVPEPKDVLPRALQLAEEIAARVSTVAAHLNRQIIWRNPGSAEAAHLVDSPVLAHMFASG